jgi:hypothetical protein
MRVTGLTSVDVWSLFRSDSTAKSGIRADTPPWRHVVTVPRIGPHPRHRSILGLLVPLAVALIALPKESVRVAGPSWKTSDGSIPLSRRVGPRQDGLSTRRETGASGSSCALSWEGRGAQGPSWILGNTPGLRGTPLLIHEYRGGDPISGCTCSRSDGTGESDPRASRAPS